MLYDCKRISYRIDRRLTGLAGPDYDATISFGLPFEPEDSQYGKYRLILGWHSEAHRGHITYRAYGTYPRQEPRQCYWTIPSSKNTITQYDGATAQRLNLFRTHRYHSLSKILRDSNK